MKVVVDRTKCEGLGSCEAIAPDRFEVDAYGTLVLHKDEVSPDDLDIVQEAVMSCPTEALRILV
jgi:ferredoxin